MADLLNDLDPELRGEPVLGLCPRCRCFKPGVGRPWPGGPLACKDCRAQLVKPAANPLNL